MKPLSLSTPHLIIMVGIPGSGKSFFAQHFATTFNAPYVSYEKILSELFNEPTGSSDEQEIVERIIDYMLDELFKTSQTIVIEVQSDTRVSRQDMIKKAKDSGYEPLVVWVQTESASAKARAIKRAPGKLKMTSDQFDATLRRFTPPNSSESAVVISGKHTYASQLKIVLKRLVAHKVNKLNASSDGRYIAPR